MKNPSDPVHFSNLKRFAESPAHYLGSIGNDTDNAAYRIGRLTHALVLGVQPGVKWDVYDGRRAGKEWDAFEAARPDVDIFTKTEHAQCLAMAKAIQANPLAMELLSDGDYEVPVEWTDVGTGRRCRTRGIDVLSAAKRRTVELKTAQSSQPDRFQRDANRLGYPAQGAWFRDAAKSMGVDVDAHFVIAVEKRVPHVVTVFKVTARNLEFGYLKCRSWMEQLAVCEAAGAFPGYAQTIVDLDLWAPETDDGDDDGVVLEDGEEIAA